MSEKKYKIYIGFSTPHKFHIFPWLIKLVEGTKFSHSYVKMVSDTLDRTFYYQASGLRVNFMNKDLFEQTNLIVKEVGFEVSADTYKRIMQFAIDRVGIEYNLKQVFGLTWIRLARRFGCKVENPIKDNEVWEFCTKLVAELMKECLGLDIKESFRSVGLQEAYKYVEILERNGSVV